MINSVQALKDKLRNISKEKNVGFNSVMRFYMYDRFVYRLSMSKYRDNFVLKGGFYLSNLFGIDNRNTMDIDTAVRKIKFTKENIILMITDIIDRNVNDGVIFNIEKVDTIRDEDEYGGVRVTIGFSLDNIKDKFHIDFAFGDSIHPRPIVYSYKSLIDNKIYKIWSYNLETVLAEKIETIFSKLEASSRMKDYYDIYLIYKFKFNDIDKDKFRGAVKRTFKKRNFNDDVVISLDIIKKSKILYNRWNSYSKKNSFANGIEFVETLECLEEFVKIIASVITI